MTPAVKRDLWWVSHCDVAMQVKLYVDGRLYVATGDEPEVLDDWPLHRAKQVHSTRLYVGACWQGTVYTCHCHTHTHTTTTMYQHPLWRSRVRSLRTICVEQQSPHWTPPISSLSLSWTVPPSVKNVFVLTDFLWRLLTFALSAPYKYSYLLTYLLTIPTSIRVSYRYVATSWLHKSLLSVIRNRQVKIL